MSGRNNRVVRNRERSTNWASNNAKIAIGVVAGIFMVIVAIIVIILNLGSNLGGDIINLDRNIPYEYFLLSEGENLGVIDKKGKHIIEAKYESIEIPNPSKDIFICTSEDGQVQILNKVGKPLFGECEEVQAIYSKNENPEVENFVLKYKKGDLYGLIDLDGNIVTEAVYSELSSLNYRPRKNSCKKRWKIRNSRFCRKYCY